MPVVQAQRRETLPVVRERNEFNRGLLLAEESGGKLVTISLREPHAELRAEDPAGFVDVVASGNATWEFHEVTGQH